MVEITIKDRFYGDVTINVGGRRPGELYRTGGLVCRIAPWAASGCPITLEICICPDGTILHRGWDWVGNASHYLHPVSKADEVDVTPAMRDTLSGLFSGRIRVDGVKIAVGSPIQDICPLDLGHEEQLTGHKIYLNR